MTTTRLYALDSREIATVLAALHFYGRAYPGDLPEDEIATGDNSIDPLNFTEVDCLFDRLDHESLAPVQS